MVVNNLICPVIIHFPAIFCRWRCGFLSLGMYKMPRRIGEEAVFANIKKAQQQRSDYYHLHSAVLEDIYNAIKPFGGSVHKAYFNCPCGKKDIIIAKIKQHICTNKHRAVLPIPLLSQFVVDNPKPAVDVHLT